MANSLIDAYRAALSAQGAPDSRDDDTIMREDLVPAAQQNPALLDAYPDFAKEFGMYREANAPSLAGEFGQALKSGSEETASTYAGLGAMAGLPTAGLARSLEQDAATAPPTIPSMSEIRSPKDAVRYVISKAGGAVPSIAEMGGLAIAGGLAGSAVEPGVGTAVGATEGALEGMLGRGIIKSAIKSLVEEGAVKDLTEAQVADLVRAGNQPVIDAVTAAAKGIRGRQAGFATNLANVYGMSAGGIYNETGDPAIAAGAGLIGALPAMIPEGTLTTQIVGKLFPRLSNAVGEEASKTVLARLGRAAGATAVGTAGVVDMEAANIIARNIKDGRGALDFQPGDWKRLEEAAAAGVIGSAPFAAAAMRAPVEASGAEDEEAAAPPGSPGAPPVAPAAPTVAVAPSTSTALAVIPPAPPVAPEPRFGRMPIRGQAGRDVIVTPPPRPDLLSATVYGNQEETPIPDQPTGPISSLLGKTVQYAGYVGRLGRDEEGAFTIDSPDGIVEVPGKDPAADARALGVVDVTRPVTLAGRQITVGDHEYEVPQDPRDAMNLAKDGTLASVTLVDPASGDQRTIRSPEVVRQVGDQLAQQFWAQDRGHDVRPTESAEALSPGNHEAVWIDGWVKGFNPYTVELSDLMDLHDSQMQDQEGGIVGDRQAFWDMTRQAPPRIDIAQANILSQIEKVEAARLSPETTKGLTDELYQLLHRTEQFEKALRARTPAAVESPAVESAVSPGAPALPPAPVAAPEPPIAGAESALPPVGGTAGAPPDVPAGTPAAPEGQPVLTAPATAPAELIPPAEQPFNLAATDQPLPASAIDLNNDAAAVRAEAARQTVLPGTEAPGQPAPAVPVVLPDRPNISQRITQIDRELEKLRDQGANLPAHAPAQREQNRTAQRDLLLERLQIQSQQGLPEAAAALDRYAQMMSAHASQDDEADIVRKWAYNHPLMTPAEAVRQGNKASGELRNLYENIPERFLSRIFRKRGLGTLDEAGQSLADELAAHGVIDPDRIVNHFGEFGVLDAIQKAFNTEPRQEPLPEQVEATPQRGVSGVAGGLSVSAPGPLLSGRVVADSPTIDFRQFPEANRVKPEDWPRVLAENMAAGSRGATDGNRSLTRIAVALQAPDGSVVLSGLVKPQKTLRSNGFHAINEIALQRMGTTQEGKRVIQDGGNGPALVSEVVAADYKPLAVLHFDGDPQKIFNRFRTSADFDESWRQTEKATKEEISAAAAPAVPSHVGGDVRGALRSQQDIHAQIDQLGQDYEKAETNEERDAIEQRIKDAYQELTDQVGSNQSQTGDVPIDDNPFRLAPRDPVAEMPAAADKTRQFNAVVSRLRQQGGKVDLFTQEWLAQQNRGELGRQIAALQDSLKGTKSPAGRAEIRRAIAVRQERLSEVDQAVGTTYSPWHIAIAMNDVQNADMGNLVTLLHEASEAATMRLSPVVRGQVVRAVETSLNDLREQARAASRETGVPMALESSPTDLLAETLAQKLAAEGVPESSSLAQSIVRWVKDLYYRVAMAAQRAFGAEPSPELALGWYENQMRRLVSGDYSYAVGRLLDRFMPEPLVESARRYVGHSDTPGGVVDYLDPLTNRLNQPWVSPEFEDAQRWNMEFRQGAPNPGADLAIEYPEAAARMMVAEHNQVLEAARDLHEQTAKEMPWEDFWRLIGTGEAPDKLIEKLSAKMPGVVDARVGGEKMTRAMNEQAAVGARARIERMELAVQSRLAKQREVATAQDARSAALATSTNKLESDFRNAALQEDNFQESIKGMVKNLVRGIDRGVDLADQHGELAQAVRQAEDLLAGDPIPKQYQDVFRSLLDGQTPIFDYMKGIASLDLPLSDMTNREVMKAIRDNADANPALGALARNRPLAVALSVLARRNANQVDQIQLGWLTDTEKFLAITDDLKKIRSANTVQLRAMLSAQNKRAKAVSLRDRLQASYLAVRADLRGAEAAAENARQRVQVLADVAPLLHGKVEAAQQSGGTAPSEWHPYEGANWTAMTLRDDGTWGRSTKTLRFNSDGSAIDGEATRRALVENNEWLKQNADKSGERFFETVQRQTRELQMLDLQRKYPAGWAGLLSSWVAPLQDEAKKIGGAASARLVQELNKYAEIMYVNREQTQIHAKEWTRALLDTMQAAGMKDTGTFLSQIDNPISYFINVNPGLEEGAAIRQATRMARARLVTKPGENFDATFASYLRATKVNTEHQMALLEKYGVFINDPKLLSGLRTAVARGWFTRMRGFNGSLMMTLIRDMEPHGWKLEYKDESDSAGKPQRSVVKSTTFDSIGPEDLAEKNTPAIDQVLQGYFTPEITQRWLEPFIQKAGSEVFKSGEDAIPQLEAQNAWATSGGNVLKFIDALAEKYTGAEEAETSENEDGLAEAKDRLGGFRYSMLKQIEGLFTMESKLAYEASQTRDLFDPMGPKPHALMDARVSDTIPAEHLNFQSFDPTNAHKMLGLIAFNGAFGRNGERAVAAVREMKDSLSLRAQELRSLTATTRGGRIAEAKARGWNLKELETAAKRYTDAETLQKKLAGLLGVNNPGSPFQDFNVGMEVLHSIAGQLVDNPKVGLYHVSSLMERPFAMHSLGPATIRASAKAGAGFLKGTFGSLLEALNLHMLHSSERAQTILAAEGASRNLPWRTMMADIGNRGSDQKGVVQKYVVKPLTMMRYMQKKGVKIGVGSGEKEFSRMALIPGLGVMNGIMQNASTANGAAHIDLLETLIRKGMQHFHENQADFQDPTFRFKPSDLVGRWDKGVFDYFRDKTSEYGMGTLEDVVRGAMENAVKGESLTTKAQWLKLSLMASQTLDGATSINTTPSVLQNNPILKYTMPLLRWPLWKMNQFNEGLKDADGQRNFASTMRGLGTLALWNLPIGIAFTFLMDDYDEFFLHKKSNLPGVDKTAALPFIGPGLALATGDRSIPENLIGFLARGAKAGNIYGLAADMLNQMVAPFDPQSGQRGFSMDQRVLVMSQFLNFQQAMRNLVDSNWTATWGGFWRPFAMSLGGNGAIQSIDILNNMLGLDNQESRLVSRINAQGWLRSAGQEAQMELRVGQAGSPPTELGTWTREMLNASMANDRMGFLDAYRNAQDAARRQVVDDPRVTVQDREREAASRVIASWRARDPLDVFRFRPTQSQLVQMMGLMDQSGRDDVRTALQRYQSFSEMIVPSKEQRAVQQQIAQLSRPPGIPGGGYGARARQQLSLMSLP